VACRLWDTRHDTGQCLECEPLRHRITTSAIFPGWRAFGHVAVAKVESICRGGAVESASSVAMRYRPGFECTQQGPTDATEPCIRRNVGDRPEPGHRAAPKANQRSARYRTHPFFKASHHRSSSLTALIFPPISIRTPGNHAAAGEMPAKPSLARPSAAMTVTIRLTQSTCDAKDAWWCAAVWRSLRCPGGCVGGAINLYSTASASPGSYSRPASAVWPQRIYQSPRTAARQSQSGAPPTASGPRRWGQRGNAIMPLTVPTEISPFVCRDKPYQGVRSRRVPRQSAGNQT
jgi:hypothetical protein